MRTESDTKPAKKFVLEKLADDYIDIVFFDNVEEQEKEEYENEEKTTRKIYVYDIYRMTRKNREELEEDIEANYDTYLANAKNNEYNKFAKEVRTKRDKLLSETDKYMIADFPVSDEVKEAYKTYRQALRDITVQENFPYSVEFPEKP